MDYSSIFINLLIAVVVAIITSNLSLRGFYKQEIWLRKETKYSQIIESLNKIQRYYNHIIDDLSGLLGSDKSNSEFEIYKKEYMVAKRELEMLASSPIFMIHKDVSGILNELVKSSNTLTDEEKMGNDFAYFDRLWAEVRDAKLKIAEIANKDLGIR